MNIYQEKGYKNRKEYLKGLSEDFGLHFNDVCMIANTLGETEDFDGLLSSLEDYSLYGE
ncbi:MAG TPA: RNA polymerase [Clostridium sp.]|nr:RNA polymerase [Clostridium sp.]